MNDPEIKRSMEAMALGEQAVGRSMPTQYVYLKEKQDREWKAMVAHNKKIRVHLIFTRKTGTGFTRSARARGSSSAGLEIGE